MTSALQVVSGFSKISDTLTLPGYERATSRGTCPHATWPSTVITWPSGRLHSFPQLVSKIVDQARGCLG
jgi:hypothetical protein